MKCQEYWPSEKVVIAGITITPKGEEQFADFVIRIFELSVVSNGGVGSQRYRTARRTQSATTGNKSSILTSEWGRTWYEKIKYGIWHRRKLKNILYICFFRTGIKPTQYIFFLFLLFSSALFRCCLIKITIKEGVKLLFHKLPIGKLDGPRFS